MSRSSQAGSACTPSSAACVSIIGCSSPPVVEAVHLSVCQFYSACCRITRTPLHRLHFSHISRHSEGGKSYVAVCVGQLCRLGIRNAHACPRMAMPFFPVDMQTFRSGKSTMSISTFAQAALLETRMLRECEAVRVDRHKEVRAAIEEMKCQIKEDPQPKGFRCRAVFRWPSYVLPLRLKTRGFSMRPVSWQECSTSARRTVARKNADATMPAISNIWRCCDQGQGGAVLPGPSCVC